MEGNDQGAWNYKEETHSKGLGQPCCAKATWQVSAEFTSPEGLRSLECRT